MLFTGWEVRITKKNQVVSDGLSNFVFDWIYKSGAAPGTWSVSCCVHAFWLLNRSLLLSLSCLQNSFRSVQRVLIYTIYSRAGLGMGPGGAAPPPLPFVREFFSFVTCVGGYFHLCYLNIFSLINIASASASIIKSVIASLTTTTPVMWFIKCLSITCSVWNPGIC